MRAEIPQTISKALKYLFLFYIGTSLFYTANHLYGRYRPATTIADAASLSIQPRSPQNNMLPIEVQSPTYGKQKLVWANAEGTY
ncbi:hypothetical protein BC938DRAFT_484235 [Jimgerdemannia flammicorona]|uniref:Uncharacterized protein n=1 Tax=Jimgerdemannia flammicorona TaxID=994334 RepID=A0A433QA93_9FUNG|nr:hypothetical protein BC938DRAFT_484235 [Jimgerdemannia flammicorona]